MNIIGGGRIARVVCTEGIIPRNAYGRARAAAATVARAAVVPGVRQRRVAGFSIPRASASKQDGQCKGRSGQELDGGAIWPFHTTAQMAAVITMAD